MRIAGLLSLVMVLIAAIPVTASADSSKFVGLKGDPNLRSASAIVLDGNGDIISAKILILSAPSLPSPN